MRWIRSYQTGPAGDADPGVQGGGEEDEQQQGEEEGRAADELKEVEGGAADAAAHHLLQDEGHERQELMERERGRERDIRAASNLLICHQFID